ncbi:sulfurtransferase TusA family protein [Marininema halotolerans]|uniref:Rhodanese-related sulfurtransferase n=1 Tax=Marininema halotolerans TaxID=1155944 RepID=A0A1I6RWS6_9BACL|nr:sulfurtransferase TusA family protein [Marininema halotolerans]SFS69142.1 Rhodanese-related sulfurtransferase [Marininema halotolerans]
MSIKVDVQLNCQGLSCPMPILRTKKAMDHMEPGQVLELQATDPGSYADIQGWAKNTGHQYLGTKQEKDVLKHYLRKAKPSEFIAEHQHPHRIENEELARLLEQKEAPLLIDVREPAEYAFGHIPGAISMPFAQLGSRLEELPKEKRIYVICRTGNRSDMAAKEFTEHGFVDVVNVVPGMSQWDGAIDSETNG